MKVLGEQGMEIICFVRNVSRLSYPEFKEFKVTSYEVDLLRPVPDQLKDLKFDLAFYLVHSMSSSTHAFMKEEALSAKNFADYLHGKDCQQVIYLSGISNSPKLSKHLQSRKQVEDILRASGVPLTVLRAGIIVGSGSASFEIIRDLMEKLPIVVAPKWVKTRCQPLGIADLLKYIGGCILNPRTYNETFDIGGAEILTYKKMLLQYARERGLKRRIWVIPFISPRFSSYWLYFVTSTSYKLAVNLVNSLKVEVVCKDNRLQEMLGLQPLTYREACAAALVRINLNTVTSRWTDAITMKKKSGELFDHMAVPEFGVLSDRRIIRLHADYEKVVDKIFAIGGKTGWYYADWIWEIRGIIDRMVGGVGLRRGRRSLTDVYPGDALDFWRVLVADRKERRLLLFAEMKLPGEAWLELKVTEEGGRTYFVQTATFMPWGLSGRLYWYLLLPIHILMFKSMSRNISKV